MIPSTAVKCNPAMMCPGICDDMTPGTMDNHVRNCIGNAVLNGRGLD